MTTGLGNADDVPADLLGRVLWAAKHFGVLAMFAGFVMWMQYQTTNAISTERKDGEKFVRDTLFAMQGAAQSELVKSTAVVERARVQDEEVERCLQRTEGVIDRNTQAFDRNTAVFERIMDAMKSEDHE